MYIPISVTDGALFAKHNTQAVPQGVPPEIDVLLDRIYTRPMMLRDANHTGRYTWLDAGLSILRQRHEQQRCDCEGAGHLSSCLEQHFTEYYRRLSISPIQGEIEALSSACAARADLFIFS